VDGQRPPSGRRGPARYAGCVNVGGPQYKIWFTNLIYHGSLYTL
jgi:hypothetical protein